MVGLDPIISGRKGAFSSRGPRVVASRRPRMTPRGVLMAEAALSRPLAPPAARSWSDTLLQSRGLMGLLFMLPAAAFLLVFLTYPLGLGVWLGFTDTRIGRAGQFIGLENYESLWTDSIFWLSVYNTVVYTVAASIVKFALGLWLALILNQHL